jgi:hypothetical protein
MRHPLLVVMLLLLSSFIPLSLVAQADVFNATRTGFTWVETENVSDTDFGAGYSTYVAAWPIFKNYPGAQHFQMGLASSWLTTQQTGNEPSQFYTTIEGGLGWWHDTRFGTRIPKFIMGGVSSNFFSWANGPGAGRSNMLGNGQRDWSSPGGKYGVAQLSNHLLWAPDGLNMAQALNGQMLGYGYMPLPLSEEMDETAGQDIKTGDQCWTLFMNTTNFKGPISFFLPTFWTEPVLEDPSLEGLFLDTRPSDPNVPFGIEHAGSPGLISNEGTGGTYAKIFPLRFPRSEVDNSIILNQVVVYKRDALWNNLESWFDGGTAVAAGIDHSASLGVPFINNGGDMFAEIKGGNVQHTIDLDYFDNIQLSTNSVGFEFDLNKIEIRDSMFTLPEYFKLGDNNQWRQMSESEAATSTLLYNMDVPSHPRSEIPYLTPLDPECQWQDPNSPWNSPGPAAGPFTVDMEDGTTLTYHWYKFIDQPAVVHANLPQDVRNAMQERVELIHSNWSYKDDYIADPEVGRVATLDPNGIVQAPAGLEIGYVPIVTRQEQTSPRVRVFILAGQSNMMGFGKITDQENDPGSLSHLVETDTTGLWDFVGEPGAWNELEGASIHFALGSDTIRGPVTVGQGAASDLIGPELSFAYELDRYYNDPVLIIKTAWGGKSLAEDFRPPSASGPTGAYYEKMVETVHQVTQNIGTEFPDLGMTDYKIEGFAWFQGWNDGADPDFLNTYEENLHFLVNDIRSEFNDEHLPIVIASSGHGGFESTNDTWVSNMQNIIAVAQESVGCNDSIYGGQVGFVESKHFYLDASESPDNSIHHFNNNAGTFLHVGRSMGMEMVLAVNDMAFCYLDCDQQVSPGVVSIGNRVWNDLNQNGIMDPSEPGIPGVSLVIWGDSDGDDIPDWQGFGGVQVTDEEGYYRFSGLEPGYYKVFVWQNDNWGEGQALNGFQSTNSFVADANNDVDNDNNGFGNPFTDIFSGTVKLSLDEEPLEDGDPFNCYFDYDGSGNNTIDFGFFNPNPTSVKEKELEQGNSYGLFPNPAKDSFTLTGDLEGVDIVIVDTNGKEYQTIKGQGNSMLIKIAKLPAGIYYVRIKDVTKASIETKKIIKL